MTIDRERLIRLLRMTESDRDAEALIAIRKTNAMLKANGASWSDVIDLPTPVEDIQCTVTGPDGDVPVAHLVDEDRKVGLDNPLARPNGLRAALESRLESGSRCFLRASRHSLWHL